MNEARRYLLILALLPSGCVVMGRSTQGSVPDLDRLDVRPGQTSLHEVLSAFGPPNEWYRQSQGTLLIYRHRRNHFGRYGLDLGVATYAAPGNPVVGAIAGTLHLTYERIQQAEVRLAVLVDRTGKVLAYSMRDARGRLTLF